MNGRVRCADGLKFAKFAARVCCAPAYKLQTNVSVLRSRKSSECKSHKLFARVFGLGFECVLHVGAMPPRKKAKSLAAGVSTPQNITTADAMPSFQKDVLSICESIFELRHGRVSDVHEKPIGLLVPEHGLFAWPICYGGTFKDIAQRCWEDGGDKLLKMSAELCNRLGLVDSADVDDFKTNFCRIDAPRCLIEPCYCFSSMRANPYFSVFGKGCN